ncbi:hypothetical protein [Microbacterium sp.]|uniref:hypothetical protein n=1 Tax=Microbacterium sp. TaxID=51671 RepID=UPI002810D66F|nr:hypothetical protein [Microbacterium sp.]
MSDVPQQAETRPNMSLLLRGALWIAIGALVAAALVCVVWVLIGDQDGLIGRAFLTILLLAAFAGIAFAEASLASRRPDWLALASMVTWIIALLAGAVKIWLPQDDEYFGWGSERFFQLLLIVIILQLALLHVRLYVKAASRHVTTFTRVIVITTFALLAVLVGMLVFYLTFPELFTYGELYWRITVAITILVAVGTTLVPLLNALFAPRPPKPDAAVRPFGVGMQPAPQPVAAWPTYADGRTPLPVMPDGSPDWNAYYTGRPTYEQQPQAQSFPALAPAPQGARTPGQAPVPPVDGIPPQLQQARNAQPPHLPAPNGFPPPPPAPGTPGAQGEER